MEQELMRRILDDLANKEYRDEVKKARDEFFFLLKDLREDDAAYERLTACFLNWYVFDRGMDSGQGTPVQIFAETASVSNEEKTSLAAMAANIHSLFEVVRIDEQALLLKDLFSSETIRVTERRSLAGLDGGDILEARLLPMAGGLVFSTGAFVLHPRAAAHIIRKIVKKSRQEGTPVPAEIMRQLQALNFRFTDRFRQTVAVEKVYSEIQSIID